jgi:hypothetical protein
LDLLLVPERFRILHLLLESVGYDGSTGELELAFYPIGITSLAAESVMIGQPAEGGACGMIRKHLGGISGGSMLRLADSAAYGITSTGSILYGTRADLCVILDWLISFLGGKVSGNLFRNRGRDARVLS